MAITGPIDHPRNGQELPVPVPADGRSISKSQFPRVPRRWVIGPWHLAVWGACYVTVFGAFVYVVVTR